MSVGGELARVDDHAGAGDLGHRPVHLRDGGKIGLEGGTVSSMAAGKPGVSRRVTETQQVTLDGQHLGCARGFGCFTANGTAPHRPPELALVERPAAAAREVHGHTLAPELALEFTSKEE